VLLFLFGSYFHQHCCFGAREDSEESLPRDGGGGEERVGGGGIERGIERNKIAQCAIKRAECAARR